MKVFVLVTVAFAIFGTLHAAPLDDSSLVDKVKEIIDSVLDFLPPSIAVKDKSFDIPKNDYENGKITLNEISITGYKKLDTTLSYDEKDLRLNFTFNFPDLAVVFDYSLELEGLIKVDHRLSVKADLKNFKNVGSTVVSEDGMQVSELDTLASLGAAQFDIKGLLDDEKLSEEASELLSSNTAAVLDIINPILEPYFSVLVERIVNIALEELS
ncbi:hypothetical protein NQ318_019822 [Aromia moschata]|uniref:Uncharacterized protein n=1 Tax=Aromia moschata TaxID=1265417 RepID=A0AAV8YMJ2_9CUCU|nr:hypothetical protein NQ318_019822 [Aromia moschata]